MSLPYRDVHMVLGYAGYRFPLDVVLLYDDAADVETLRQSFQTLCEQIKASERAPDLDIAHAMGHWKSFDRPPPVFRQGSTKLVLAAMSGTPIFGQASTLRSDDVQRFINTLAWSGTHVFAVGGNTVGLTPAISQAVRYTSVEYVVRVTPGTTVRFQLFAEEGVRTKEAQWDLHHNQITFRGGPVGDRAERQYMDIGRYHVAVKAGGYREYLANRSPEGIDNTVIQGSIEIEVKRFDPSKLLALEEYKYEPTENADEDDSL